MERMRLTFEGKRINEITGTECSSGTSIERGTDGHFIVNYHLQNGHIRASEFDFFRGGMTNCSGITGLVLNCLVSILMEKSRMQLLADQASIFTRAFVSHVIGLQTIIAQLTFTNEFQSITDSHCFEIIATRQRMGFPTQRTERFNSIS
jgi:hypothetical protein